MPPASASAGVAASGLTLSIFASRSARCSSDAASSSVKVRVAILMSMRHGRSTPYVRSVISMITRLREESLTSLMAGRKRETRDLAASNALYVRASAAAVVLSSVPCAVLRKLATWPAMTALRSSSSSISIFSHSSRAYILPLLLRRASSPLTHACSFTWVSVRRVATLLRIMPCISPIISASGCACLHVHSAGAVMSSMSSIWFCDMYGKEPKTIACSVTPKDHTSARKGSYLTSPYASGAVYVGVPGEPETLVPGCSL
mmetsp:Transcript_23637/g.48015  ORF Transcript_23637/g.48015 Transcript_23637/m.48015 type:complete len:260 (+) Transcript_23637:266-1045(+)